MSNYDGTDVKRSVFVLRQKGMPVFLRAANIRAKNGRKFTRERGDANAQGLSEAGSGPEREVRRYF